MAIQTDALTGSVDLDFTEIEEHWNIYQLSDGTKLKVKLIVRGVKRLNQFEPDGAPVYLINSMNVVRALDIPESVKAKPKKSSMPPV
ncbi:MAG: hypothetical protein NTV61_03760 [Candidatus Bathyarchaeota archaeon]|nr:hypothetical protein [Candidatus Bathyarchaeota archaeon]